MAFICSCSGEIEIPNFPTRKVQSSTKIQEVWGHNCSPITQAKTMKTSSFDPGISEYEVWIPVWGWSERSSPGVAVTFWLAHLFLALFGKCIADLHPFFCRASGLIGNIFGLDHVDFFRKSTTITHIHTYTYQYLLVIKSPKKHPSFPINHPFPTVGSVIQSPTSRSTSSSSDILGDEMTPGLVGLAIESCTKLKCFRNWM